MILLLPGTRHFGEDTQACAETCCIKLGLYIIQKELRCE